jgi:serine protease Do
VPTGQNGYGISTGSGFIITKDGFVVTNQHVVDGNGSITVITTDGTEYPATLVGADSTNDVALLKVEALNLRPVTLGSSEDLIVGDQVAAIGNPLGELTSTLTVGYISAKERDVTTDGFAINMLQTDAAINSGNSGGPLFNMRGEVIGITTAKYSGTSSSGASIEGVGFAIPIDDVVGILSDLANYGYVTGGYLGVMVSDMDAEAAAYYGMPVGAYVQEVTPGYAAQKAGLRAKDIIVELGGYEVRNVNGLTRALRHFKAGDETAIVVYRGGQKLILTVVLDEKPVEQTTTIVPETTPQDGTDNSGSNEWWYDFLPPFFGGND